MNRWIIHILPQSHIDIAWLWPYYPETIYDCVKLTFMRAIDNLKMNEEYTFAQSQVPLYEAAKKYFPEIFDEILKYVKNKRWDIVGGTYVEFEGAEPCGESLVRQCLFGQKYFIKKFGVKVEVGWLPDSWTLPWQLPQIFRKSGIKYLLFFRGAKGENIFWWESPDGTRILACKPLRGSFTHRPFPDLEDMAFSISQRYGVKNIPLIIGRGDHGGGPTYQEIQNIREVRNYLKPKIKVCFSTPHRFFKALLKEADKIPVLKEELDWELVGDLVNCAKLKEENSLSEIRLLVAEKFSSIAMILKGTSYPQTELNSAWENVLFNQFHDIIGGSIVSSAQEFSHKLYKKAIKIGGEVLNASLKDISSMIDTSDSELNIIVFNSLSWNRTDLVNVELEIPEKWNSIRLLDPEGREISIQIIKRYKKDGKNYFKIIFIAEDVPSLGYKVYRVFPVRNERQYINTIKITGEDIENNFFKIKVSKETGHIESIFDKENNVEVLDKRGNILQLIEDLGDSEGRLVLGINRSNRFIGYRWSIDSKEYIEISERGPVRAILTIKRFFSNSTYIQRIIVYSNMRRIDFDLTVDWNEIHRALKILFPLNIVNPILTVGIQYGSANRVLNDEEQPFQKWIDISERDGSYGTAILSDTKYSYSAKNNVIGLTLLRSPTRPAYNTDRGIHNIRYSIYPHRGGWKESNVVQKSYEFKYPLIAYVEGRHKGLLPKNYSFISIWPKNAIIECIKKAEDDKDLIIRIYECNGVKTRVQITLNINKTIKNAYKTNLLEDEVLEKIEIDGNKLNFLLNPYEIATIKVKLC